MGRLLPRTSWTPSFSRFCQVQANHPLFSFLPQLLRRGGAMSTHSNSTMQFEDFLPSMARKLGAEAVITELCKGFQLLMDPRTGRITFRSLKRNAARLGLGELGDDELSEMMREGDIDGDGVLDQMEFCILMVRLSPELMEEEWHRISEC